MNEEEVRRYRAAQQKRIKKRNKQIIRRLLVVVCVMVLIFTAGYSLGRLRQEKSEEKVRTMAFARVVEDAPDFEVQLLTPNAYSRPQLTLEKVDGIVVHYTANPGTSAKQNHDYFEGLKDSKITKASSHFIIGTEGEIIQCIPSSEIAYASNNRNNDTLSIECCHLDETGQFTQETYDSLVHLTAWLCGKFDLTTEDVIRHYDVTGKACPLYFVEHEDAWEKFLLDVQKYIEEHGVQKDANEIFS